MEYKVFEYLSQEAIDIRTTVFVGEQGFNNEFDDNDNHALHIIAYTQEGKPIAVCRIIEKTNHLFVIGRVAVIKEFRGQKIGESVVKEAEKVIMKKNGKAVMLHAQCKAKLFYNKLGYFEIGNVDDEEGCPHIWMKKTFA